MTQFTHTSLKVLTGRYVEHVILLLSLVPHTLYHSYDVAKSWGMFVLSDLRDSIRRSVVLTSNVDYVINTDDDDADDGPDQHEQHPERPTER